MIDVSITLVLYILYLIFTSIFLLLDNKNASSTFAWFLINIFFPIFGLILYIFIGRGMVNLAKRKKWSERKKIIKKYYKIFAPLIAKQKSYVSKLNFSAGEKKLLHLLNSNSNSLLTINNKVDVFNNGKEKFSHLLKDLQEAKKFIHMEYFIWEDDALTQKVKKILIEKAKKGVEVRILYDAVGCFSLGKKYINELKKAGVKIYPTYKKIYSLNYRDHRKIVVIDSNTGYIGGMNMGQEYIDGGKKFPHWRDTHLRIRGYAVPILQIIFAATWEQTTKEKLFHKKYYDPKDPKGTTPIQITTSGPDSEWSSIEQLYFALIYSAEKEVLIQSPYFIPSESMLKVLKTEALSGTDIKIMVTGVPDKKIPYFAAFTFFDDLLRAGVKIYHYNRGFLHSKVVITDNKISSVGTANMDLRSLGLNYEINTLIYDKKISNELKRAFQNDLKYCKEFTLKDYEKLSLPIRLRNSIARLFSPLL